MASSVAEKTIGDATKGLQTATELIESVVEALFKILSERANNENLRALLQYGKEGGELGFMAISNGSMNAFMKKLQNEDIPCWPLSMPGKDQKMLIFRECDVDKINSIRDDILVVNGKAQEVSLRDMCEASYKEDLGVIRNLDEATVERLRNEASTLKFTISVETSLDEHGNKKNDVYFRKADEKEMQKAMIRANWDLSGYKGAETKAVLDYEIKNTDNIFNAAQNGMHDIYIVSARFNNEVISITDKGFTFSNGKEDAVITYNKDDKDYAIDLYRKLRHMDSPVVLNKAENQLDKASRKEVIKEKNKTPLLSDETFALERKERQLKTLFEARLMEQPGNPSQNFAELLNNEESFTEFFGEETKCDDYSTQEQDVLREHIREAIILTETYEVETIHINVKDLDTLIADLSERAPSAEKAKDKEKEEQVKE